MTTDTLTRRVAPARIYADPDAPAISDAESLDDLDERFDPKRPLPVQHEREIDPDDAEWAAHVVLTHLITSREGATFIRFSEDVFGIGVYGGQILHHDRHLADMANAAGFSEHTWNLAVEGGESQQLLLEVGEDLFTSLPLAPGSFTYMNTANRHAVTRTSPNDTVVLVQVDGFGPDEDDLAFDRIAQVLASRPDPVRV